MNVKFYMADTHACGHFRGELPSREINAHYRHRVDCKTTILMSDYPGTDLMVFQRQTRNLDVVQHARKLGIATIYELDDDIWGVPEVFAEYGRKVLKPADSVEIMEAVDAITVSTRELAAVVRERVPGKPVFVIENAIDVEAWSVFCAARESLKCPVASDGAEAINAASFKKYAPINANPPADRSGPTNNDKVVIGWMASQSHLMDAPLVGEALRDLMSKYTNLRLHFIGWIGLNDFYGDLLKPFKDRIKTDDWLPLSALPTAMLEWDIGLLPLIDHPWNRSKSALKWMQYACMGIPAVASPLPCYQRAIGDAGLIAEHNAPAEWYEHLSRLAQNAGYRRALGARARQAVYMKHDIRARAGDWVEVWEEVVRKNG